jgi:hypothetical protein
MVCDSQGNRSTGTLHLFAFLVHVQMVELRAGCSLRDLVPGEVWCQERSGAGKEFVPALSLTLGSKGKPLDSLNSETSPLCQAFSLVPACFWCQHCSGASVLLVLAFLSQLGPRANCLTLSLIPETS